jgi:hypothetical protein
MDAPIPHEWPVAPRRLATLRAALGFLQLPPRAPELKLLHRWLDTWPASGCSRWGCIVRAGTSS